MCGVLLIWGIVFVLFGFAGAAVGGPGGAEVGFIVALALLPAGIVGAFVYARKTALPKEQTAGATAAQYLGGLPEGSQGVTLYVRPEGGQLRFYNRNFETSIPLKSISAVTAGTGSHIRAGRVAAVGVAGVLWKAKDHYLLITYRQDGIESQVVLKGLLGGDALERLRQAILRERSAARGRSPVVF